MTYTPEITDHFTRPRNAGHLPEATHTAEATNEACLDHLRLNLRVEGETVMACTFQAQGCVPVLALGSWVTLYAGGKTISQLKELTAGEVERLVGGLPKSKKHAAYLLIEVLQAL